MLPRLHKIRKQLLFFSQACHFLHNIYTRIHSNKICYNCANKVYDQSMNIKVTLLAAIRHYKGIILGTIKSRSAFIVTNYLAIV
jgi:hypothetical protein